MALLRLLNKAPVRRPSTRVDEELSTTKESLASSPGPFPAFQCCTLKSGRAWYAKSRAQRHTRVIFNERGRPLPQTPHQRMRVVPPPTQCTRSSRGPVNVTRVVPGYLLMSLSRGSPWNRRVSTVLLRC